MQKYLLHSTLIASFSGALIFRIGFDLKVMYFIVLINLMLFIYSGGIKIPKGIAWTIFGLITVGLLTIQLYNNELSKILFQVSGLSIISLYFYNFFLKSKYSYIYIYQVYCKYIYWLAIIGLFIFFILLLTGIDLNRILGNIFPFYGYPTDNPNEAGPLKIKSLFLEPVIFGGTVLPAFFYYYHNFKKYRNEVLVIGLSLICTFSLVTYVCLLFGLMLMQKRFSTLKLSFIAIICVTFGFIAYNTIEDVKVRVDDTTTVLLDDNYDFEGINLSTYAILSNLYVTGKVFQSNPIIGHGIGSHPISHKMYISGISGTSTFAENGIASINDQDANSLLLRIISELGLLGLFFVFFFIKRNYSKEKSYISKAVIVFFFYKLLRDGHYFSPEMYFFVFIYYFHKINNLKRPLEYAK